ncbi:hypothetical protein FA95DRAFT_1564446, partial [Auriscalpium vulgare]
MTDMQLIPRATQRHEVAMARIDSTTNPSVLSTHVDLGDFMHHFLSAGGRPRC